MSLLPQPLDQAPPNIYLLYPKWKGGEPSLVGEENRTKEIRITFRNRSTYTTLSLSCSHPLSFLSLAHTLSFFPLSAHTLSLSLSSLLLTPSLSLSLSLSLSQPLSCILSLSLILFRFHALHSLSINLASVTRYGEISQLWHNF